MKYLFMALLMNSLLWKALEKPTLEEEKEFTYIFLSGRSLSILETSFTSIGSRVGVFHHYVHVRAYVFLGVFGNISLACMRVF